MIKDLISNAKLYYSISEYLKEGLVWLEKTDLLNIADGKYEINGDKVFASVQTYQTKDDAKYESHRKYIDIQYVISGQEKIGVVNVANCTTCVEYESQKDLEIYDINQDDEYLLLNEGQFIILYPHDAHKPSIKVNTTSNVKKVVVKVAL